jgi:hypothetical protein
MKSSNLFWGFFFITFGALYLLSRYTSFIIDWYAIWDLWPIVIILIGVSIILKGTFIKPVISLLMGIVLGLFVYGLVNDLFDISDNRYFHNRYLRDFSENNYQINFDDSIKHVDLKIDAGAGKFQIERTSDDMVKGYSQGNIGEYIFKSGNNDSLAWVNINMEDMNHNFFNSRYKNDLSLQLNDKPSWSFDIKVGAAKLYFNLIPFDVKDLSLQTGATDTKIKLGNKSKLTNVKVKMGAAALKIYIPKTSGCKITGNMALVSKDLDGFEKHSSDYYVTDNYENAQEKIDMEVEGGIASFKVEKY